MPADGSTVADSSASRRELEYSGIREFETEPCRTNGGPAYGWPVIPTVLVLSFIAGLVIYRRAWWLIPVAAIVWTIALSEAGTCTGACSPGAAAFAALNATVGVSVALAARWMVTRIGRTPRPTS
jgi:hypothetical protein